MLEDNIIEFNKNIDKYNELYIHKDGVHCYLENNIIIWKQKNSIYLKIYLTELGYKIRCSHNDYLYTKINNFITKYD